MRCRMKKALVLVIAVLMIFANSFYAYAAETPSLELIGAEGNVGDVVNVELVINNNPGITSFSVELSYPVDKIELVGVEAGDLFSGGFSTSKMDINPFIVSWFDHNSNDIIEDGIIAIFSFKIISLDSSADLSISYDEDNIFNSSFENQHFEIINSEIKHHEHSYEQTIVYPSCMAEGYTEYYCIVCGYSYKTDYTASTGNHNYQVLSFNGDVVLLKCKDCGITTNDSFKNHINERGYAPLDMNDDGIVNAKDYAYLIKNYFE